MFEIFANPFYTFCMGLALGAVFLVLAVFSHWKTKGEFRRYKTHLSDKLELEARQMSETNKEKARLASENESLRMQVSRLNEKPDNKLNRELEIMARAEKHMIINAPGFAPACGTCFRPESGHIELSGAVGDHDEWDTAVILHELGHHIAATWGRDDSPGGRHDGDRTWPALAWSEGFATFHAAWQQGDPRLGDLRPAGYQVIDLETLEDPRAYGTDDGRPDGDVSELLVAALLWDVFDGGPDDDDGVEVPNDVLWPALLGGLASLTTDQGAPGLDLLDVLEVLAAAAPEADLAALARARGIAWPR